ncbi:uncharacterized protein LOC143240401 [Tachypleus tridentatus]|uniref:uncharacterized protein LOC143240401 n=1 Tax=Tachypleus tridentatus TaxID=6853 RepID=UPI003FD52BEC
MTIANGDVDSGGNDLKGSNEPESPSVKRRSSSTGPSTQASPTLPELVPPPPISGFGDTIVASNPFDDTCSSMATMGHQHMPAMNSLGAPPMHNKPVPMGSGKMYPPDQPMVFNPQNPNAPPIYPCGICHKEVHDNDQAVFCESGCNFWFHRICTGLTDAAFHLLTVEVYAEWDDEKTHL